MTRIFAVIGSCIAAGTLLCWSIQSHAAGQLPQRPGSASMGAFAPKQEKWSTTFDIKGAQHAVFNFVVSAPGKVSINIQSQGDPVSRFLVRPNGSALYIANPNGFEYTVTTEDISRGQQWKVDLYLENRKPASGVASPNPNGHASGGITFMVSSGAANDAQVANGTPRPAAAMPGERTPMALPTKSLPPSAGSAPPPAPLAITSVRNVAYPNVPLAITRPGDTVVVTGTGLDGISNITVQYAKQNAGAWYPNPNALATYAATPFEVKATDLKFKLPDIPPGIDILQPVVVTLTKGSNSVTGKDAIMVGQKPQPRKITSVEQDEVLSGAYQNNPAGRVRINGSGFDDVPGPGGYSGVIGGYFGEGTPGSTSNPMISVANRSATYVELWPTKSCDQHGILMLVDSNNNLITADPPIVVGCSPAPPAGYIDGSNSAPNGRLQVAPGATITIKGTGLRVVTGVADQSGGTYQFTYNKPPYESLTVTLPNTKGGYFQFYLQSKLSYYATVVQGYVQTTQ